MSEGILTILGVLLPILGVGWAAYLTYKGNERIWKLETAIGVLEAKNKTLEAAAENQKESQRKSDEVNDTKHKAANVTLEAERELRRKSDTANEVVITGLRKEITSLTEQNTKLEKRNDELAAELAEVRQQFKDLLQAKTQPQVPIPTPALAVKET